MTTATIENVSPLARQHWCAVKFHHTQVPDMGELVFLAGPAPSRAWRAVRGRRVGDDVIVYVRADLAGHEIVSGTLMPPASDVAQHEQFRLHPWVADDFKKLIVTAGLRINGRDVWTTLVEAKLVQQNSALQRWWTKALGPNGLILELWGDVWHDDPVVDIYGAVVWSDRQDPDWNALFEGVWLKSGELLALDFARRHGVVGGAKDHTGQYVYLLGRDVPFCDGSALPLSGAMLCFQDREAGLSDDQVGHAIRQLQAAAQGPVLGVAHDRNGRWLAHENTARVQWPLIGQMEQEAWSRFESSLAVTAGWHADRPVGCTRTPGQTGAQEDFGSTKGTLSLPEILGRPRQVYRLRYAVQADLFRGLMHYENGKPLDIALHPRWVTWSGITHFSLGVSPDRLGKEAPRSPANGWNGYDAQHRSQNNLAAYLALHDDPLMTEFCVQHMLTTDFADYRRRYPNNGADSARGQGRPIQTWANFLRVTGNEQFGTLCRLQVVQSYNQMQSIGNGNAMRVLSTIGPDGRVPIYIDGVLQPSVSMWEHGLALVGFYGAHKTIESSAWLNSILMNVSLLLAEWALHETSPGQFQLATSIQWNNGDAPQAYLWDSGSGVGGWIRAGLMVAREFLGTVHPLFGKLDRYLKQTVRDPEEALIWAEWWAAVRP